VDEVFQAIFALLRGDATLLALLGTSGTALIHREWPHSKQETSAADPAWIILDTGGFGATEAGDARALDNVTFDIHIFVRHFGFGRTRMMSIRDRLYTLLNGVGYTTTNKRALPFYTDGEILNLYEQRTQTDHGVMTLRSEKVY